MEESQACILPGFPKAAWYFPEVKAYNTQGQSSQSGNEGRNFHKPFSLLLALKLQTYWLESCRTTLHHATWTRSSWMLRDGFQGSKGTRFVLEKALGAVEHGKYLKTWKRDTFPAAGTIDSDISAFNNNSKNNCGTAELEGTLWIIESSSCQGSTVGES